MSNNAGKNILNLIVEENLASAQQMIKDQLSGKLSSALDSKFEEFASTIFESKKSKKKKDWDGDGKLESDKDEVWGSRKKAANAEGKWLNEDTYCEDGECEDAEHGEIDDEETEDSESDDQEEETDSDDKGGKKGKKKSKKKKQEEEDEDGE
jgi:hypothetical protein